jgi:hypothetical protein
MNMSRVRCHALIGTLLVAAFAGAGGAAAQEAGVITRIEVTPASIVLRSGESTTISAKAYDSRGNEVEAEFRFTGPRGAVSISQNVVLGLIAGEHEVVASVFPSPETRWEGDVPPSTTVPTRVLWPEVASVAVEPVSSATLYHGTTVRHRARAVDPDGSERPAAHTLITWTSSNPSVASVDRFGNVTAHATGSVEIVAQVEGTRGSLRHDVRDFPAQRLELAGGASEARTGDVLRFRARALDAGGREIPDVPITWSHTFIASDSVGPHAGSSGQIRDGKFVGELPGEYTILAMAGPVSARRTIELHPRNVVRPAVLQGQGQNNHSHTSDFWVFEGLDGRDYGITGTHGADGYAYIWDITDPTNIFKTDSVQVDARTVNDVKVSPDSRYATMTREGASNRRNGVVFLDLATPAHPTIASVVDEGLTGGVHNAFPQNEYAYALSGGEKYVIIDVRDIYNPRVVSEVSIPGARIHDVWVVNGIAYSAQRPFGGVIVDVGNGRWGGSPENPVVVNITGAMPEGSGSHGVFPYYQESTGRMLLFLGDEILNREGRALGEGQGRTLQPEPGGTPSISAGYLHIVDVTDPDSIEVVARYHVPEYGTHNTWVEDDILYQAYWEGGVRVVDVSGELMGNLADQGREIAVYKSWDPNGYVSNAPFVWSAMPFKGNVFFSDYNSGLWSVEVQGLRPLIP